MNRLGLVLGWLLAAGLVTFAAWQVVSAAESQTADDPLAPVIVISAPSSQPAPTDATSPQPPTSDPTITSATSSTTTPHTSTTAPTVPPETVLIPSSGGTVTVARAGDQVSLVTASPAIGFKVDVEHGGPEVVEVKFERFDDSLHITVRAWVEAGTLVTETKESSEDRDDD